MQEYNSFSNLWADLESDASFQAEKTILDFTLQLHQLMEQRKVSKKDLAEAIGTSQAYITKIFKGNANFTIATMTKLAHAIDGKITIHVTGKEEKNQQWFRVLQGKKIMPRWRCPEVSYQQTINENTEAERVVS